MKQINLVLLGIFVLVILFGGFFWLRREVKVTVSELSQDNQVSMKTSEPKNGDNTQNNAILQPSADYVIRPDFTKVKNFTKTLVLQKGVSVRYGNGWTAKGDDYQDGSISGSLFKTIKDRSYVIGFEEKEDEFLASDGAYANNGLKVYQEVQIKNKPHFIITSSVGTGSNRFDYAYISSCPVKAAEACSLPLQSTSNLLFVMLRQNVPNAQYPVELDFSRKDDQQILAEFAEIMSTLKY